MSQLSSSNQAGDVVRKRSNNVYTWMLVIAMIALMTACILLLLELQSYGSYPWWKPATGGSATSQLPTAETLFAHWA